MKQLLGIVLLASLSVAQEAPQPGPPKWEQKVFDLKFVDPRPLANLMQSLSRRSDTRVNPNVELRAISVGTFEPGFIALAEELVSRYDKPSTQARSATGRNIELIVHMILAAPKGSSGNALPGDLDAVAKQLRSFGYNDFQLMDTAILRNREGLGGDATGNAGKPEPGLPAGASSIYRIAYKDTALTMDAGKPSMVRIDGFRFSIRIPFVTGSFQPGMGGEGVGPMVSTQFQYNDIGFSTNLDIREGQKVVVGKNKIDSSDKALILVVSARAVD